MKFISSFYRYTRRFVSSQKHWSLPSHSEVLIFDACNHTPLLPYIRHRAPVILPIRWEAINIPILIASLFRRGNRTDAYLDAFIEAVDPKIIITFIDNTLAFYRLKPRHPQRITLFIQNGWRSYEGDIFQHLDIATKNNNLTVDYMLCFNASIAELYRNYIAGNALVIGSLLNNKYTQRYRPEPRTIGFISQWIEEGFHLGERFHSQEDIIAQVDRLILPVLQEQIQDRGGTLYIMPRTSQDSPQRRLEESYFTSLMGSPCRFLEYNEHGSSYRAIDSVEVVVGIDSTLVYESLARGNKTAVFSIRGHILEIPSYRFGWPMDFPNEGAFWTNLPDCKIFKKILDSLFDISEIEWKEMFEKTHLQQLMAYDPGNGELKKILDKFAV